MSGKIGDISDEPIAALAGCSCQVDAIQVVMKDIVDRLVEYAEMAKQALDGQARPAPGKPTGWRDPGGSTRTSGCAATGCTGKVDVRVRVAWRAHGSLGLAISTSATSLVSV
ncbi:hypothetical protein [Lentzea sp. NEAU-D7]|uniref:hypothetical protein n=1 Tax=Lentzea sp. NEAU-D7 TaxID=2994667 RepID=UPI00224B6DCD|nr:hypothetical protein [Lentzea sp. NEAU-D7]MCX2954539.1 hypothetical protein [Lentzea sp. NEAU-D7]